ncbi:amino acid ABC transporter permease [Paraburkholderia sp. IW21]
MSISTVLTSAPLFARAALVTGEISVASILLGAALGFVIHAALRNFPRQIGRAYQAYVWVLRGTPFLVQLFIVYYGAPSIGITPSALQAAIGALALYASAYFAEIFRSAWSGIPLGHAEAALSLGISRTALFLKIEAPQALRFSIPLLVNQSIIVLKESALASMVTVPELTMTAGRVVAETFSFVEPYSLLALAYWAMAYAISSVGRRIEQKVNF